MATVDDLIPEAEKSGPALSGNWYGYLVDPIPIGITDECYFVLPDIDPNIKWGPARWPKQALSIMAVNREVLVIFDNRQNPWVVDVW